MNRPKFTVIQGGLAAANRKNTFVSAYVTDTRLMGVLAVYAHWQIEIPASGDSLPDIHQFFYIDCEEAGLETYQSVRGSDMEQITMTEQALIGGLGAGKVSLTEKTLRHLLCIYRDFHDEHGLPLPENFDEYGFIFHDAPEVTAQDRAQLLSMICTEIVSDYQVVNYFLMRCFGRDYEAAAYLASGDFPLDIYDRYKCATFCKNVIDKETTFDDGAVSYICESLVEMNGQYETVISKVAVKELRVVDFCHCSGFHVSAAEAAMMLAKPEFVTVYEVLLSDEDIDNNIGELSFDLNTIMSVHDNGRLFMSFKKNNDHVNDRVFRLSNDVSGIYFLTDYGQLIVAAYTLPDIRALETRLRNSLLAPFLVPSAKYEFKEPVLFEFIQSDFDDFDDFLDFIKDE